ncbi:MAG: type II secretion system F family protein [Thermodesulfobacteriota bacterium]
MSYFLLIPVFAFAAIALSLLGLYYWADHRRRLKDMMERVKSGGEAATAEELPKEEAFAGRAEKYLQDLFEAIGRKMAPGDEEKLSRLQRRLVIAGYRRINTPLFFRGAKVFSAGLFFAAFSLFQTAMAGETAWPQAILLSLLGAAFGFYLPDLWLKVKIVRRKEKIVHGLPDALDLLVICVEAGLGVDAAIDRVEKEIGLANPVLGEEFRLIGLELRAGAGRARALKNLAIRTDLEEVSSLAALLVQSERFGLGIAQALRVHSDSMRAKRYQKAEEIAGKLPVKLLFPLILFIFPIIFIILAGPGVIRIIRAVLPTLGS